MVLSQCSFCLFRLCRRSYRYPCRGGFLISASPPDRCSLVAWRSSQRLSSFSLRDPGKFWLIQLSTQKAEVVTALAVRLAQIATLRRRRGRRRSTSAVTRHLNQIGRLRFQPGRPAPSWTPPSTEFSIGTIGPEGREAVTARDRSRSAPRGPRSAPSGERLVCSGRGRSG